MRTVRVDLGDRSYDVHVGEGLLARLETLVPLGRAERAVLVADGAVARLWGSIVEERLGSRVPVRTLVVEPGERSKTLERAGTLLSRLAEWEVRRNDLLVTLGGGMVGDLGGFVASLYQRGMPLVHLPTTVAAQVDAAIGGKTAVNLPAGKNLIGTFHQPVAVVADTSTLATLDDREFRAGAAEVIKYALTLDRELAADLRASSAAILARDPPTLEGLVARCAALKAGVVAGDELDTGNRVVLNYGHTFGHALEALGGYERWLHGEAVAVGMVFAAALAEELGLLGPEEVAEHLSLLELFGLATSAEFDPEEVVRLWNLDKKYVEGRRWVLLEAIGKPVVEMDVGDDEIRRALRRVRRG